MQADPIANTDPPRSCTMNAARVARTASGYHRVQRAAAATDRHRTGLSPSLVVVEVVAIRIARPVIGRQREVGETGGWRAGWVGSRGSLESKGLVNPRERRSRLLSAHFIWVPGFAIIAHAPGKKTAPDG